MSLIRKHVAVLQAWACLALVFKETCFRPRFRLFYSLRMSTVNVSEKGFFKILKHRSSKRSTYIVFQN